MSLQIGSSRHYAWICALSKTEKQYSEADCEKEENRYRWGYQPNNRQNKDAIRNQSSNEASIYVNIGTAVSSWPKDAAERQKPVSSWPYIIQPSHSELIVIIDNKIPEKCPVNLEHDNNSSIFIQINKIYNNYYFFYCWKHRNSMEEQYPSYYEPQLTKIKHYEQFYRIMLTKYKICTGCLYRIFSVMTPKIYTDTKNNMKFMEQILKIAENKCKQANATEGYNFFAGEYKVYYEQYLSNNGCDKFCWLCSGTLQQKVLKQIARESMERVKQQHLAHKQKYKLNVKIHNLFNIKFQIFCNLALAELEKLQIFTKLQIQSIRKDLILPLFEKTGLDLKTVFKWKISNFINQQPADVFTLCSTINQDEQTVIISLEIDHNSSQIEKAMTNLLGPYLQFEKTKAKKGRIQLQQNTNYTATWTANLISRIPQISSQKWLQISEKHSIYQFMEIQKQSEHSITHKISLQSQNIFFSGRYVKFSRYLSQTPWIINKQRLIQSSLQDEVQRKLLKLFYPEDIPQIKKQVKFHAGGREDIDVRMLKGGRPFVLQFVNPRKCLSDLSIGQILTAIEKDIPELCKKLPKIQQKYEKEQQQIIKCNLLQFYINNSTQLAKINSFKKTTSSFISKQLKQAQIQKIKHYVCYIKSQQEFCKQDKIKLESCHNLAVLQKTPVRVLHRRTLMYRDKVVHKMIFHPTTKFSAVLQIWASAGTYIKEFVHGDLNRTVPNVGLLINKSVDILQLDVGSLKQGQWNQGDDELMKLGSLAWEDTSNVNE